MIGIGCEFLNDGGGKESKFVFDIQYMSLLTCILGK